MTGAVLSKAETFRIAKSIRDELTRAQYRPPRCGLCRRSLLTRDGSPQWEFLFGTMVCLEACRGRR